MEDENTSTPGPSGTTAGPSETTAGASGTTAGPSGTTAPETRSTKKKNLTKSKKPPSNKPTRRKMLLHSNINKQRRAVCRLEYQISQSRSQTSNENMLTLLKQKLRYITPRRLLCLITYIQMRKGEKESRGRRWSTELKIACLSLWLGSPAIYRLLIRFTHLPSIRTLRKVHHKIPAMIGLNGTLLRTLASTLRSKPKIFKICVLLFDEIPLRKGLHYNDVDDSITGFEDFGQTRKLQFADRALVFMARGILADWKQPIAYYLSHGPVSPATLKRLIMDVIKALQEHFFKVMAVVCDHKPRNRAAIKALLPQEAINEDKHTFRINGESIVTLWDPPRLLVATQDSLKGAEVKYIDGEGVERYPLFKVASDMCKKARHQRNGMVGMAIFMQQFRGLQCEETNEILFFHHIYKLFDTFNAPSTLYDLGTVYSRRPVQKDSPHHAYWKETLPTVRFWTFWKDERLVKSHVNDDWVKNIEAIQVLWAKLSALGARQLKTIYVNLDALENFFHQVRLFGIRKTKPDCHCFDTRLKATLVAGRIRTGNRNDRESDFAELLLNMEEFLVEKLATGDDPEVDPSPCNLVVDSGSEGHQEVIKCSSSTDTGVDVPVGTPAFYKAALRARQVLKRLPRVFRNCKDCLATVYRCTEHGEANCLCTGVWPTTSATKLLWLTKVTMLKELKVKAHYKDLTTILVNSTRSLVYDELGCNNHRASFVTKLLLISARMCMQEYIGTVNTNLSSL